MATPTDPTGTSIVTEAWKKAGIVSPSSAELTRAEDEWLQEIFNDIWHRTLASGGTRLKSLSNTLFDASVKGTRQLSLNEDFDDELEIIILDGDHRDTAQAGASTTITLASDEDLTEEEAVGYYIFLTGGTGADQYVEITAYDEDTKVATVSGSWSTNPDSTTTYLIVSKTHGPLDEIHTQELDGTQPQGIGIPTAFAKWYRTIYFDKAFDLSTYGIQIRYYMTIHQVDLSEGSNNRITRIFRSWHDVLKTGVQWKCEQFLGFDFTATKAIYEQKVSNLLANEIPFGGEFAGFSV